MKKAMLCNQTVPAHQICTCMLVRMHNEEFTMTPSPPYGLGLVTIYNAHSTNIQQKKDTPSVEENVTVFFACELEV